MVQTKAFKEKMGTRNNNLKQFILLTFAGLLTLMAGCTGQLFNETSWSSAVLNDETDSVVYGTQLSTLPVILFLSVLRQVIFMR